MDERIFLVGMMGSGKSTVGKALAKKLHRQFFDCDQEIEKKSGVNIQTIFDVEGEEGFRKRETRMLDELTQKPDTVLATGGGVVVSKQNRKFLRSRGLVIYISADPDDLYARLKMDTSRPLLKTGDPAAKLRELYKIRDPLYRGISDFVYETSNREKYFNTVNKIMRYLKQT